MKWENGEGVSTKLCSHRADRGRQRGQREGEKRWMTDEWGEQFSELCLEFINVSSWEQYRT